MSTIELSSALDIALIGLGVCFLVANLWIAAQVLQLYGYRTTALVTRRASKPPQHGIVLGFDAVFAVLLFVKFVVRGQPLMSGFGESMMLLYYAYLWPMCFRSKHGLYADGI